MACAASIPDASFAKKGAVFPCDFATACMHAGICMRASRSVRDASGCGVAHATRSRLEKKLRQVVDSRKNRD